ncbi:peroxiredoxin Q/BCP [Meinhardsimonia xiamenensis]|jgi:peroxiredoxin Q/BCP|uniref:thioredoxin-dependent peroxiredoxin n=1 Tax=Meinhardsimonia xiamenensis TaxID=990712 RepID=A0A1G9GH24_9RHOB|nr:thioredoxin-dependent thiol peroxidase [Meinhardsimonia xiamenensis]PRX31891.1 peroxiredoxin Q/BCP [Meinhardsimonia xiamenensis]SDK99902.1 peroxiredoxin Q/BCP [Meinhardsimonia xiamenensis]
MDMTGKIAPDFALPGAGGGEVKLSDFRGRKMVLYFYPKDDTPGCTTEALDFTGLLPEFEKAGAVVIGISKDPVSKHEKFRDKHGLKVILASDAEGDVCERYGVWGEKTMYGRKFKGITRSTFLIGPDGRILREWRNVKVKGHAEEVLKAVREA